MENEYVSLNSLPDYGRLMKESGYRLAQALQEVSTGSYFVFGCKEGNEPVAFVVTYVDSNDDLRIQHSYGKHEKYLESLTRYVKKWAKRYELGKVIVNHVIGGE